MARRQPSAPRKAQPEAKDRGAGIGTPVFPQSTNPNAGNRLRSCSTVNRRPGKKEAKKRSGSTQMPGLP
jgi:hypothetical protein